MDRVVDWIGSTVVGILVEKIDSYISQQSKELQPDMRKELERLENGLSQLQSALMVAEKQKNMLPAGVGSNSALERWKWQLRDVVEEAEDLLDEIEYYQIEKQVTANRAVENKVSNSSSGSSKKRKLFDLRGMFWPTSVRDPMLDKLRDAICKLDAVKTNAKGLIDIFNVPAALTSSDNVALLNDYILSNHETGHMLAVTEVFGRDREQKQIVNWLMHADISKKISALTICGMGGLGKTTLFQAVFNDESIEHHFQLRIWICVSNQFVVTDLLTKAIESATRSSPTTKNLSVLQQNLLDIVIGNKFLLVLDDAWDDADQSSWEKFFTPLKHGARGRKILITTRQVSVGKMIPRVLLVEENIYNLLKLGEDDCTLLFNKHAFAGSNPDGHKNLQEIGKKIIEKCGGVPLAVKLAGGLLGTHFDYDYWLKVWENDILKLGGGMNDALEVLKISYRHLPPNLQACFRICSICPQDYQFTRSELVQIWVGVGLIQQSRNDRRPIEEIGEEYLDSLQSRSFFEIQDSFSAGKIYVMHDLMHDLAQVVSEGECLTVIGDKLSHIPKTLRHLSVCKTNQNILNHVSNLQHLRTLHLSCEGMPPGLLDQLTEVLTKLKLLRVLCLYNLPATASLDSIGQIKYLRHLEFHIDSNTKHWFPILGFVETNKVLDES